MKSRSLVIIIILIACFGLPGLDFLTKYQLDKKYSGTDGAKFLEKLDIENESVQDESNIEEVPYKISLYLNGEKMNFKKDILYKNNRFYISLSEFSSYFDSKEEIHGDNIIIKNVTNIDLDKKVYKQDDRSISLRGEIIKKNNDYYISFFDLCEIFNVNTYWDYDSNNLYMSKRSLEDGGKGKDVKKKQAFIRFEDFTAGDVYITKGALEKVRVVADYMNIIGEKFNVAWVPRYIDNTNNIDNDISKKNTIQNDNFIFTLDYFLNRGGRIGLHGYTHQYKDSNSVVGFEFGDDGYNEVTEIRKRVESALMIANKENIPISFWETPHYKTTNKQQQIFEEYFKIIYEPSIGVYNKKIIVSKTNGITKYIPTPMGYVDDDGTGILDRIKNKKDDEELSLFYHLSCEIKSIDIFVDKNGEIEYSYGNNSILKKIIKTVDELGFKFEDINNVKS